MSKALKKLIDINRLREFKNKLVGTGSAYVQTAAVDQTIAGTKTFSKPIVGSVTGSSGSCTGNAASATKLATARKINGTSFNGTANITTANWGTARNVYISDSDGTHTGIAVTMDGSGNVTLRLPGVIKADLIGNTTGVASNAEDTILFNGLTTGDFVRTTGNVNQTVTGTKTFNDSVHANGFHSTTPNAFMAQCGGYTLVIRNDGSDTYLLMSDKDGVPGTWSSARPLAIHNSTGVCNINGNASTAIKLATARTIALSGAATGTATGFDGSGNITIPVTALSPSAIRAQWYAAYPDGAEAHNAMWGGRDITAAFNNGTVSANIANGTFKDIFPGDYITKQVTISGTTYTVNWVVADCDYWWHKGDLNNNMETHHVAIVSQQPIFNANMNAANTTEGGYAGSRMYKETIPACATGIVNAFGSSHILTFRDHLTQDLNTSAVSSGITVFTGAPNWNGAWHSQQCNLMSEAMVYDGPHCASSALDNIMATRQMSAFRLSEKLINYNRHWWWLRDVVSSASFALVGGDGGAGMLDASFVGGVRPFALLR